MRRPARIALALLLAALLSSCDGGGGIEDPAGEHEGLLLSAGAEKVAADEPAEVVLSRLVYVPIYSHIYLDDPDEVYPLTGILSIRNTDPERPLYLSSIRYINTDGSEVRDYLSRRLRLAPLSTVEVVVRE